VATTQNGERAMMARQCTSSRRSTLSVERLIGFMCSARSAASSLT
jgi:hypothetical protein